MDDTADSGSTPTESVDWNARNVELFEWRGRLRARESRLERLIKRQDSIESNRELRRVRRQIEDNVEEILYANTGLAKLYVRRFTREARKEQIEDYLAAGIAGLHSAIISFNPAEGRFSSWAQMYIRREVLNAVQADEHPTISVKDFEMRKIVLKVYGELLSQRQEGGLNVPDVAAKVGLSEAQVRRILEEELPVSLDSAVGESIRATKPSANPDDYTRREVSAEENWLEYLKAVMDCLNPQERLVLMRREGLDGWPPETLEKIGKWLGLSREKVRRVEKRAREKVEEAGLRVPKMLD